MLESILGDKMKKFFVLGILMIVAGVTFLYKEPILKEYYQFYASNKKNVTIEKINIIVIMISYMFKILMIFNLTINKILKIYFIQF